MAWFFKPHSVDCRNTLAGAPLEAANRANLGTTFLAEPPGRAPRGFFKPRETQCILTNKSQLQPDASLCTKDRGWLHPVLEAVEQRNTPEPRRGCWLGQTCWTQRSESARIGWLVAAGRRRACATANPFSQGRCDSRPGRGTGVPDFPGREFSPHRTPPDHQTRKPHTLFRCSLSGHVHHQTEPMMGIIARPMDHSIG